MLQCVFVSLCYCVYPQCGHLTTQGPSTTARVSFPRWKSYFTTFTNIQFKVIEAQRGGSWTIIVFANHSFNRAFWLSSAANSDQGFNGQISKSLTTLKPRQQIHNCRSGCRSEPNLSLLLGPKIQNQALWLPVNCDTSSLYHFGLQAIWGLHTVMMDRWREDDYRWR